MKISNNKLIINKNDKFGLLSIIEEVEPHITSGGLKVRLFLCQCDCGNKTVTRLSSLRTGKTTSCGCNRIKKLKFPKTYSDYEYQKKWRKNNKDKISKYVPKNRKVNAKKYYERNKKKICENAKNWVNNNRDKRKKYINQFIKEKKDKDKLFKLKTSISSLIRTSFRVKGYYKKLRTEEILGCSIDEFRIHIESKFEPWMNWNNYGNWNGIPTEMNTSWDIDHIIPTSSATSEDDVYKINHYSNLRPLCSYVNRNIKRGILNYVE